MTYTCTIPRYVKMYLVFMGMAFLFFIPQFLYAGVGGSQLQQIAMDEQSLTLLAQADLTSSFFPDEMRFAPEVMQVGDGVYEIHLDIFDSGRMAEENVHSSAPDTQYVIEHPRQGINRVSIVVNYHGQGNEEWYEQTFALTKDFWVGTQEEQRRVMRHGIIQDGDPSLFSMQAWQEYGRMQSFVIQEVQDDIWGDRFGYFYGNGIQKGAAMQQVGLSLEPGHTYELRFMYQLRSGTLRAHIGMGSSNVDVNGFIDILDIPTEENEWRPYIRHITIPNNAQGDGRLVVTIRSGEALLDSIYLLDVTHPLYVSDWMYHYNFLVRDPGFELNSGLWRSWGRPRALERIMWTDAIDDYALRIDTIGGRGGVQQMNIPVEPGKTYNLSFYYYLRSGVLRPRIGLGSSNIDFEMRYDEMSDISQGQMREREHWSQYVRTFYIPEGNTRSATLVLEGVNGEVLVDGLYLQEVQDDFSVFTVEDGYMESQGTAHWKNYGSPRLKEKRRIPRVGEGDILEDTAVLFVDTMGGQGGVQQLSLPLKPSTRYRFTFDYLLQQGTLHPRIGMGTSNSDFEGLQSVLIPQRDWQRYDRVFTTPADMGTWDGRIVFWLRNGQVAIDNVYISEL